MLPAWWKSVVAYLFGSSGTAGRAAPMQAWSLLRVIEEGGLQGTTDDQLIGLVRKLLTIRELRIPLRGNTRFLESVAVQHSRKGQISFRQRQGILNILERAYPHNLVVELRRHLPRNG